MSIDRRAVQLGLKGIRRAAMMRHELVASERDEHASVVALLRWKKRDGVEFIHVHNEFWAPKAAPWEMAKAWKRAEAKGARPGAADLLIQWKDLEGRHCSLWLELKREGGRQSEAQKRFAADFRAAGAMYEICYGYPETEALLVRLGILK